MFGLVRLQQPECFQLIRFKKPKANTFILKMSRVFLSLTTDVNIDLVPQAILTSSAISPIYICWLKYKVTMTD